MKTNFLLSLVLTCLIFIGSSFNNQIQPPNQSDRLLDIADKPFMIEKPFYDGMIIIKVKKGFGNILPQKGNVRFDHDDMDKLVQQFNIHEVAKRFRHRPIPKDSDLPDLSRIYRISFPDKYSIVEVVTAFSQLDEVEYAEPVPIAYVCEDPNDPKYSIQQHLPQIQASEAWNIHHGEDGPEIIVGINDTGVDWDHPDLVDNMWQNLGEDADGDGHVLEFNGSTWEFDPGDINGIDDDGSGFADDFLGWDYYMNDNDVNPNPGSQSFNHGTHCSGIAAGRTNNGIGIASVSWNIKIFATQIDDGDYLPWGYDGIIYAAEMGVDISSNSWASWYYSRAEEEAIAYATGLGTIVVAAAGNQETNFIPRYPAGYSGVISVASVSADDTKANYSNWGKWVDISAPGGGTEGGIYSTYTGGEYGLMSGTSMATPMVAGLFGLLKSYHPTWSNDQLIVQVMGTADDIDALNPGMENELGSGRINANRALDTTTNGPEELRLEFISVTPKDENENGILEQGETVIIDLTMWNRCPASTSANTTFYISSDDPDIDISWGNYTGTVPYDSYFTYEDAFMILINDNASPHVVEFSLDIVSDINITFGDHFKFYLPIMASGVLVYEGVEGGDSYSGTFLSEFFSNHDIEHAYTSGFPETFTGYEMAFLSFGNWASFAGLTKITPNMADIITEYVENGGKVYLETSELFGFFERKNLYLSGLFGINYTWDGTSSQYYIEHLEGQQGCLTENMFFTESDQEQNFAIDLYETTESGQPAFVQNNDTLAVQNIGDSLQRTFVFSYSAAELVDRNPISSRFNFIFKVLEFFGHEWEEGYVISNFNADTTYGEPGLVVNFSDWTLYDTTTMISSWEWDFNGDGVTDSWDQNPSWQYDETGQFSVSLTVSTDYDTNTFTHEEYIWINDGILVFEGVAEGPDYSGTFIKEFMDDNSIVAEYTNSYPPGLLGYDAVFLSFGNVGSGKTRITGQFTHSIINYLENGGKCYIEGGDCILDGKENFSQFSSLFSILTQMNGTENDIDSLTGKPEALTSDMIFTGTNQTSVESIDMIYPSTTGTIAFEESDYFVVGVQGEGSYGQKTFVLSYALAALEDGEYPSTRDELLHQICIFFDIMLSDNESPAPDILDINLYPNPARDQVVLEYNSSEPEQVELGIYDVSGELMQSSTYAWKKAGVTQLTIDLAGISDGVYILRLRTGNRINSKKLIVLR